MITLLGRLQSTLKGAAATNHVVCKVSNRAIQGVACEH